MSYEFSNDEDTWKCAMCTFKNQANAIKCIMCSTGRECSGTDHQQAADSNPSTNPDIDKPEQTKPVAGASHTNHSSRKDGSQKQLVAAVDNRKWDCPTCTYENYNRSTKCCMCQRPRSDTVSQSGSYCVSTPVDENLAATEDVYVPDDPAAAVLLHKWACPSCTKYNYPKTLRCSVCGEPKLVLGLETCNQQHSTSKQNTRLHSPGGVVSSKIGTQATASALLSSSPSPATTWRASRPPSPTSTWPSSMSSASYSASTGSVAAKANRINKFQKFLQSCIRISHISGDGILLVLSKCTTFTLPSMMPNDQFERILHTIVDNGVTRELIDEDVINWLSPPCTRLYALWNRKSGDCLLDSVLQACLGICDNDNILRRTLAISMSHAPETIYEHWLEHEKRVAMEEGFQMDSPQINHEWKQAIAMANQRGSSLGQIHIFVLAHILKRPIVVYASKYVKSLAGILNIGLSRIQGVYLPLCLGPELCFKFPIALAYTTGHFSALIPMSAAHGVDNLQQYQQQPVQRRSQLLTTTPTPAAAASLDELLDAIQQPQQPQRRRMPSAESCDGRNTSTGSDLDHPTISLTDSCGFLLPVHFTEQNTTENLMKTWMHCLSSDDGYLLAKIQVNCCPARSSDCLDNLMAYMRRKARNGTRPTL